MSRIVIREVSPEGLHGFRPGQLRLEGLGDGLNVVFAPNATGKSTLAQAMGLLLNPQSCADHVRVSGVVAADGGETMRLVRKRDERFPGAPDRASDYLLDIVQLLKGLTGDDRETLSRLVGSGLNIAPGSPPSASNVPEVRRATEALSGLVASRRTAQQAAEDEERIPRLRADLEEAERADRAKTLLRRWQEQQRLSASLTELTAAVAAIESEHPGIAQLRESAEKEVEWMADAVRDAHLLVAKAEAELGKSHPEATRPPRTLTDAEREAVRLSAEDAALAVQSLRESQSEARRHREECDVARAAILRLIEKEDLSAFAGISEDDFRALARAATEADEERTARVTREAYRRAREEWLTKRPEIQGDLDESWVALRQWLEAEPIAPHDPRPTWMLALAAIALLLTAAIPNLALRLVVALAGAVAAFYVGRIEPTSKTDDRRSAFAERAGLTPNARPQDAAQRLSQISDARAWQNANLLLERGIEPLLESNWPQLADRLRLRVDNPYALAAVSRSVDEYLRTSVQGAKWQAKASESQERLNDARDRLLDIYGSFGFVADANAPEESKEAFFQWFVRAEARTSALANASKKQSDLARALDEAGIPFHEDPEFRQSILRARAAIGADYRRLKGELANVRQALSQAPIQDEDIVEILGTHPEFATEEKIEHTLADLEQRALGRDAINQEIGACQDRIRNVANHARLEWAEAAYGQAAHRVESRWRGLVGDAVKYRIRTHLKDRMRNVDLPDILKAANLWVAEFTSQRYRLVLGAETRAKAEEGLGVLTVYDTRTGREQAFSELSTGTKVHVVLALRLGLIERHEHQANGGTRRFPLLADEIMAVSDPDASEALARALVDIAKVRQVVVFTNQPDDVHVFRRLSPEATVRTLTSMEIAPEAPLPGLRYVPPMGPRRLDLRLPIRSHAPASVLPGNPDEWPADAEPLVDALEKLRLSLVADYPRLEWGVLAGLPWAKSSAYREAYAELAQACEGDGRQFLAAARGLRYMKANTVEEIRQWLDANGYLSEPPTHEEMKRRIASFGLAEDPYRAEFLTNLFLAAFESTKG